jgi:periplasmic protein TonB
VRARVVAASAAIHAAIALAIALAIGAAGSGERPTTIDVEIAVPPTVTTELAPPPPRPAHAGPGGSPVALVGAAPRAPAARKPPRAAPPAPPAAAPGPALSAAAAVPTPAIALEPTPAPGDPSAPPGEAGSDGAREGGSGIGTGSGDGDGVDIDRSARPVPLDASQRQTLPYTEEAARARVSGSVVLQLMVDPLGRVGRVTVRRGLGHGLDEIAMKLAMQIRFRPALDRTGQPTAATVRWGFHFQPP